MARSDESNCHRSLKQDPDNLLVVEVVTHALPWTEIDTIGQICQILARVNSRSFDTGLGAAPAQESAHPYGRCEARVQISLAVRRAKKGVPSSNIGSSL